MSAYFASGIDIICERLVEAICVSTSVGESLVVNLVYYGYVVAFMGGGFVVDLILLDIVNFDVILCID